MLVGSGFGMVNFGLGRGERGAHLKQSRCLYSIDTYDLVDKHIFKAHQTGCSSVNRWRSEPSILEIKPL